MYRKCGIKPSIALSPGPPLSKAKKGGCHG